MRRIAPSSADEMIAAWLLGELDSERWRWCVLKWLASAPESIVRIPNLSDPVENALRGAILAMCRGWRTDAYMFPGFPTDATEWSRVELDPAEVLAVRGSIWEPWGELASPTRTVGSAAAKIAAGTHPAAAMGLAERARSIERRYRAGDDLGPPILAGHPSGPPWVALEGHGRLLGWALAGRAEPFGVFLGVSDRVADWKRFA